MSNFNTAISTPIVTSASFSYKSSKEAEDIFSGKIIKPLYSRMGNPTNNIFENKIAKMDGGIGTISTSSGMAAISMACMALCSQGDEILAIGGLFGGSYSLFSQTLPRFGINTKFFAASQLTYLEKNINDNTKIIYCESVGNPNLKLVDIQALGKIATKHKIAFIIDNTITPKIVKPFKYNADIIVYSTTKIISGNSSALGGAVVARKILENDKFRTQRYDFLSPFLEKLGASALIGCCKKRVLRDIGMSGNAYANYQNLLGLETLSIRNKKINKNCKIVAQKLYEAGMNVNHPSLKHHTDNKLYNKLYKNGCGSMLTIDMGDKITAFDFLDKTKNIILTANIGDSRTLALHMASTIYADFTNKQREYLGVNDGLIRISIGLENPNKISKNFIKAFLKIRNV